MRKLQLLGPRRMTQLAQRLRLDLTNALARHVELLPNSSSVVVVFCRCRTAYEHIGFTRGQLRKYRVVGLAQ